MKILHILSQMPDFTGSGKTIQAIIRQARAKGHDNFLVAGIQDDFYFDPALVPADQTRFVRFNGGGDLDFRLPGMSDVMPYPSTVFSSMGPEQISQYEAAFEKAVQWAKDRFSPDIVHSHHLWIVSKIARKVCSDLPMVTSCHGTCLRQASLCPLMGSQMGPWVRQMDGILCLSRHQKDEVRKAHGVLPDNLHVVGAGFEKDLFYPGPKPLEGPVEMVYAGKLSRSKGVVWLLRSLKKLSVQNFRLHLAGSGSGREKDECLELAQSLGDQVVVHGPLSHETLSQLMRQSHLFVLPSFFEGLPLVLMEALSSGCRILTTALPGTREILGDVQSDMVDLLDLPPLQTVDTPFESDLPGLEDDLAKALGHSIHKVLADRQPDFSGLDDIIRSCTWENVFSRMERAYGAIMKRSRQ